jgi:hypothetical protein
VQIAQVLKSWAQHDSYTPCGSAGTVA